MSTSRCSSLHTHIVMPSSSQVFAWLRLIIHYFKKLWLGICKKSLPDPLLLKLDTFSTPVACLSLSTKKWWNDFKWYISYNEAKSESETYQPWHHRGPQWVSTLHSLRSVMCSQAWLLLSLASLAIGTLATDLQRETCPWPCRLN